MSIFRKKCAVCKKKAAEPRKYFNEVNKPIVVCEKCVMYAERRAFRKRTA
ncbi:hypothetical protein [Planococcus sp. CAU13]|nr:hypothetical protein [Planococcus sp. CAU13]